MLGPSRALECVEAKPVPVRIVSSCYRCPAGLPAHRAVAVLAVFVVLVGGSACRLVPEHPLARDARRSVRALCDWTALLRGRSAPRPPPTLAFMTPARLSARLQADANGSVAGSSGGPASGPRLEWADVMARLLTGRGAGSAAADAEFDRILGAQVAGYYDPRTGEILVASEDPVRGQDRLRQDELLALSVSHEIVHALDDARFGLDRQLDASPDDDAREALAALYEGMAVSVNLDQFIGPRRLETVDAPPLAATLEARLERLWEKTLRGTLGIDDVEGIFQRRLDAAQRQATGRFLGLPLWRRAPLLFRYFMGTRFVLEARRRYGRGILDRVATDPPRSTAQILHPERVFERRGDPVRLGPAPSPFAGRHEAPLFDGVMGELALCLVLGAPVDRHGERPSFASADALSLAAHWRGDRLTVWPAPGETLLSWRILTDGDAAARSLAAALSRRLDARLEVSCEGAQVRIRSVGGATVASPATALLVRAPPDEPGSRTGLPGLLVSPFFHVAHDAFGQRARILGFLIELRSWETGGGGASSGGQLDLIAPAGLIGDGSWAGPLAGGWLFHRRVTAARSQTDLLFHLLGWRTEPGLSAGQVHLQPLLRYRWGEGYGGLELGLGALLTAEARADDSGRVLVGRLFDRAVLGWDWGPDEARLHVLFLAIDL